MDGYTVDEAATVLGIPQGRVWELLARGVLVGTPEGETGMRVFLKAERVASEEGERHGPSGAARGTNGNGGQRALETEMSPFRELLTEFRNLTERYGQALLALGEARGEVAALRSRVELLETRMDVALPSTRRISTVAWEMPDGPPDREAPRRETTPAPEAPESPAPDAAEQPEPIDAAAAGIAAEEPPPAEGAAADEAPTAETPDMASSIESEPMAGEQPADQAERAVEEPMADQPAPGRATAAEEGAPARPRRERQSRISGLGSFADALARAQDPTLAQLPGGTEAAEALADLQREIAGQFQAPGQDEVEATEAAVAAEASLSEEPVEPIITEAVSLEALAAEELMAAEATEATEAPNVTAEDLQAIEAPAVDGAEEPAVEPPAAVQEQEPIASPYSADVVEPDWFADGDFTWLDAGRAEESSVPAAEPVIAEEAPAEAVIAEEVPTEPVLAEEAPAEAVIAEEVPTEPVIAEEAPAEAVIAEELPAEPAAAEPEPESEEQMLADQDEKPAADGTEEQAGAVDFEEPAELAADDATGERGESTEDAVSVEIPDEALPAATEPPWPDEPTIAEQPATQPFGGFRAPRDEPTAISPTSLPEEELMFLGDEFEASSLEASGAGWRAAPAEAEPTARPTHSEPPTAPAAPEPAAEAAPEPPGEPESRADRGVRAQVLELSDRELARLAADEGWDVEEVQAIRTFLGRPEGQEPEPTTEEAAPPAARELEAAASVDERPDRPGPQVRAAHPGSSDSDWLHGRRGPAANAYRRLRRLFPG